MRDSVQPSKRTEWLATCLWQRDALGDLIDFDEHTPAVKSFLNAQSLASGLQRRGRNQIVPPDTVLKRLQGDSQVAPLRRVN